MQLFFSSFYVLQVRKRRDGCRWVRGSLQENWVNWVFNCGLGQGDLDLEQRVIMLVGRKIGKPIHLISPRCHGPENCLPSNVIQSLHS